MKSYRFVFLIGTAAAILAFAPAIWAAPQPGHAQITGIPAIALSRHGQYLAAITLHRGRTVLTVANAEGGNAHAITIPGGCEAVSVHWAPHRNRLAILSDCKSGSSHDVQSSGALWVLDVHDPHFLRKLADFNGTASQLQWRSDGKVIAFLYTPAARAGSHTSVIAAVPASGGALHIESPAGFDVHEFHLSRFANNLAYTATPAVEASAPPKLYMVTDGQTRLALDPATATGALHNVQIRSPRWSFGAGQPGSLFFLGKSATGSAIVASNLYLRMASHKVPIANLTSTEQGSLAWFMPTMGTSAFATRIVGGSTQLMGYTASDAQIGPQQRYSWRDSTVLCTIPGTITDGHGPGSMAFAGGPYGGKVAYFEYPNSDGPPVLRERDVSARQCSPQRTINLVAVAAK
ncbi:MAG: hypothetical protein ACREPK_02995 [Rhodanobacteraceae bacterium]